jgi:hypothetical protein
MDSVKINLKIWLAGLIAGVILMERWRRYGARKIPQEGGDVSSTTTPTVSADKPKVSTSIVTGAKADAERVKQLLGRSTPESSTSA